MITFLVLAGIAMVTVVPIAIAIQTQIKKRKETTQ